MYFGPERKNQRLKEFDYSSFGFYFVTICTKNRENHFGEIIDGKMNLGKYGEIVEKFIKEIPVHFPNGELLKYVVMPNHLHIIIGITAGNNNINETIRNADDKTVGNENFRSLQYDKNFKTNLSNIIKGLKIGCTNQIRKQFNNYEFAWQKSFYERIIRDENEYNQISEYIENNPLKWEFDKNNIHP